MINLSLGGGRDPQDLRNDYFSPAERDAFKLAAAQQGSANDGTAGHNGRERTPLQREWDKQEERRTREDARDAKQDSKQEAKQERRDDRRDPRAPQGYFNEGQR